MRWLSVLFCIYSQTVLRGYLWDNEKVALLDKWPLKRSSVHIKNCMTGQEKGDGMDRFDCTYLLKHKPSSWAVVERLRNIWLHSASSPRNFLISCVDSPISVISFSASSLTVRQNISLLPGSKVINCIGKKTREDITIIQNIQIFTNIKHIS